MRKDQVKFKTKARLKQDQSVSRLRRELIQTKSKARKHQDQRVSRHRRDSQDRGKARKSEDRDQISVTLDEKCLHTYRMLCYFPLLSTCNHTNIPAGGLNMKSKARLSQNTGSFKRRPSKRVSMRPRAISCAAALVVWSLKSLLPVGLQSRLRDVHKELASGTTTDRPSRRRLFLAVIKSPAVERQMECETAPQTVKHLVCGP